MLGLVWCLYASFGIANGSIPPLVDPIVRDLGLSYVQMGLVLGAWQLVYIGTASPLGAVVDRFGVQKTLGVGVLIILASMIARGLAVDFSTLFLAVAMFGVGGPIISIGAPKVVSLWFEGHERGLAAGIYTTGPMVGTTFSLATAASLVMPIAGTWRAISLVYGAIVLVVAAAWWLLARDLPDTGDRQGPVSAQPPDKAMTVFRELLRLRNMRIILILAVGTFLLNHGLTNWMPTLLQESGMSLAHAGAWSAGATAASALGVLLIPRFASYGRRAPVLGLLLAAAALSTLGLASLSGPALLTALFLSALVRAPMMPISTLVLMETRGIGSHRIGAASGLFFAAAEIGGFSGPFLLGIFREATGALTAAVVALAAATAVLIIPMYWLQERHSPPEPDR